MTGRDIRMREFTLIAESTHACLEFSALVEVRVVAGVASVTFVSSVNSWGVLLGFLTSVFGAGLGANSCILAA